MVSKIIKKKILASSYIDKNRVKISPLALTEVADSYSKSSCAISIGIEHDITIRPIGEILDMYIEEQTDGEVILYGDMELFSEPEIKIVAGEEYFYLRRGLSRRCFALGEKEDLEEFCIILDSANLDEEKFVGEVLKIAENTAFKIQTRSMIRRSAEPNPEIIMGIPIAIFQHILVYLALKIVDKKIEPMVNYVCETITIENIKRFINAVLRIFNSNIKRDDRNISYIFKTTYKNVNVDFVYKNADEDVIVGSLMGIACANALKTIDDIGDRLGLQYIQFLYFEGSGSFRKNYMLTTKGEIIGTKLSEAIVSEQKKILEDVKLDASLGVREKRKR